MNPTNTDTPTFYKGDTVRIKDNYFNSAKRGKQGTVLSTGVRNTFLSGLVIVKLDSGEDITLTEISLELVEDTPVEGEIIRKKDIKVGQTIRVTYSNVVGSYIQTSTKEGVITRLRNEGLGNAPTPIVKPELSEITLSFGSTKEVYTLIKDAPEVDEIAEALKELKPGSVAQIEDKGFGEFVITYVKTSKFDENAQCSLWTVNDSRYPSSSSTILETSVRKSIRSIDQIVVKL